MDPELIKHYAYKLHGHLLNRRIVITKKTLLKINEYTDGVIIRLNTVK